MVRVCRFGCVVSVGDGVVAGGRAGVMFALNLVFCFIGRILFLYIRRRGLRGFGGFRFIIRVVFVVFSFF